MAVDQQLSAVADVRRQVAFRALGAKRVLLHAQAALEDVEGALAAGQYETALIQARTLVMQCLAIRSLARAGELDGFGYAVSFDPFAGLTEPEIAEGLGLLQGEPDAAWAEPDAGWAEALAGYLRETEALLGYDAPLPVLRSPEGTFAALRLARQWAGPMAELNLPNLLPANWTQPQGTAR